MCTIYGAYRFVLSVPSAVGYMSTFAYTDWYRPILLLHSVKPIVLPEFYASEIQTAYGMLHQNSTLASNRIYARLYCVEYGKVSAYIYITACTGLFFCFCFNLLHVELCTGPTSSFLRRE